MQLFVHRTPSPEDDQAYVCVKQVLRLANMKVVHDVSAQSAHVGWECVTNFLFATLASSYSNPLSLES